MLDTLSIGLNKLGKLRLIEIDMVWARVGSMKARWKGKDSITRACCGYSQVLNKGKLVLG